GSQQAPGTLHRRGRRTGRGEPGRPRGGGAARRLRRRHAGRDRQRPSTRRRRDDRRLARPAASHRLAGDADGERLMARGDDLSTPKGTAAGPVYDPDQFGALAERLARFFGTPRYLIVQTGIVILWIAFNAFVAINYGKNKAFDPYPFILLNLAFSTQAAYAAPLILLAQNRQADRDKAEVERDRDTN